MASHRNRDGASSTSSGLNHNASNYQIYSPFSKEKSKECVLKFPALNDPKDKNTEWIYDDVFTIMRFLQQLFPEMEQAFTNLMANADSTTFGSPRSAKQFFDRVNGLVSSVKKMLQGTSDLQNRHLKFESDDYANLLKLAYNAAIDDPENLNHESECFSEERYGETEYKTMDKVIEALQLTAEDQFLDLGSGCGQIVLYVAAKIRCKSTVGIEKVYERHKYAKQLRNELLNILRWLNAPEDLIEHVESCTIERGDFLQGSSRNYIKQSTAIYANNIVYGPKINLELTGIFKELLDDGVRIVCTLSLAGLRERGPSTRNFDDFAYLVDTEKLWAADMSWTSKKIDFTKHVVNRDKYSKVLESVDDPEKLQKLCAEFRRNRPNYREESDTDETVSYLSVPMPHHHYDQFQRLAAMRRSAAVGEGAGGGIIGLLDNNYSGGSDADEHSQANEDGHAHRRRRGADGGGPMQSSLHATGRRSRRQRRFSDSETVNDSPRRPDSMNTSGGGGIRSRLAHASLADVMTLFSHLQDVTAASLRVGNDGTRCYDTTPKSAYDMLPEDCRPAVNKWLELTTQAYDVLMNPTAELELNNLNHGLQAQRIALIYEIARLQADRSTKRTFEEITHKTLQKFAQYGVCCSTTPALAEFILSTLTDHIKHFREFNDLSESLERDDATDHIMPEVRELVTSTLSQLDHAKQQLVAQAASNNITQLRASSPSFSLVHEPAGSSTSPMSYFSLNLLNTLLFQGASITPHRQNGRQYDDQSLNVLFDPNTHRYHLPLPPVQSLTSSSQRQQQCRISGATIVDAAAGMPLLPPLQPLTMLSTNRARHAEMMPSFVMVPPPAITAPQPSLLPSPTILQTTANLTTNLPLQSEASLLADVSSMTKEILQCRKRAVRIGSDEEGSQKENDSRFVASSSSQQSKRQIQPVFDVNIESLFSLQSAIDRVADFNQLPDYELFQPVCVTSRQQHQSKRILTPPPLSAGKNSSSNAPLALLRPLVSRFIPTPHVQPATKTSSGQTGRPRNNTRNAPAVGGGGVMSGKRRRESFLLNTSATENLNDNDGRLSTEDGAAKIGSIAAGSEKESEGSTAGRKRPRKHESDVDGKSVADEIDAGQKESANKKATAAARWRPSEESSVAEQNDDVAVDDDNVDEPTLPTLAAKKLLRRSAKVSRERGRRGSAATLAADGRRGNARATTKNDEDSDYAAEKLKNSSAEEEEGSSNSTDSEENSDAEIDEDEENDTKAAQRRRGRRVGGARPAAARRAANRSNRAGGGAGGRGRTAAARRAAAAARGKRKNADQDEDADKAATDASGEAESEHRATSEEPNSDDDGSAARVTRSAAVVNKPAGKKQPAKARKGKKVDEEKKSSSESEDDKKSVPERKPAAKRKYVPRPRRRGASKCAYKVIRFPWSKPLTSPSGGESSEKSGSNADSDKDDKTKKNVKEEDSTSPTRSSSVELQPAPPPAPIRRGRGRGRGGIRSLLGHRRGAKFMTSINAMMDAGRVAHLKRIRAAIRARQKNISREGDEHEFHLSDDATLQLSGDDAGTMDGRTAKHILQQIHDKKPLGRVQSSVLPRRRGEKASGASRRGRGRPQQQQKQQQDKQRSMSASPVPRNSSQQKNHGEGSSDARSNNTPLPPRLTPTEETKNKIGDSPTFSRRLSSSSRANRKEISSKPSTPLAAAAAAASTKKLSSVWKQHGGSFGGDSAVAAATLISSGTISCNRTAKAFLIISGEERLNGSNNGITSPSHGPRLSNMKNKGTADELTLPLSSSTNSSSKLTATGNADGNRGTSESATSPHFSDITPVDDDEENEHGNSNTRASSKRRRSGDVSSKHNASKVNGVLVGANDTLTLSPSLLSFVSGGIDTPTMPHVLIGSKKKLFADGDDKLSSTNGTAVNGPVDETESERPQDAGGSLMSIVRNELGDLGDNQQHTSAGFPPKISSSKIQPFPSSGTDLLQPTTDISTVLPPSTPLTQLTILPNAHIAPPILPSAASLMPPILSTLPPVNKPAPTTAAAPLVSPSSNQLGPTIANVPTVNSSAVTNHVESSSNISNHSGTVSAASLLRAANVNNSATISNVPPNKPGRPRSNATHNSHSPAQPYSNRPPSQQQHHSHHQQQSPVPQHKPSRPRKPRGGGAAAASNDHSSPHPHHRHGQQQQPSSRGLSALNSPPAMLSASSYTFPGSSSDADVWTPAGAAPVPSPSSRYGEVTPMQSMSAIDEFKSSQLPGLMPPPPSQVSGKPSVHQSMQQSASLVPHNSWMPQTSYAAPAAQMTQSPPMHQRSGGSNNYLAARGSAVAAAAATGLAASGPTHNNRTSYQNSAQQPQMQGASASYQPPQQQQQHGHPGFVLQPPPPPTSAAAGFLPPQHHHHHASQQHLHQQPNMTGFGASSSYPPAHAQQQQQYAAMLHQQQQHLPSQHHAAASQAAQLAAQYQNNFNLNMQQQQQQRNNYQAHQQQPHTGSTYGQPPPQQTSRHHSSQVSTGQHQHQPHYGSTNHAFPHFHS